MKFLYSVLQNTILKKMNTLVVRIPEEQKIALKLLAGSKNVSVAKITRKAIEEYVCKMTESKEGLLARLARIGDKKKAAKAPADLSENYKKYLYGKASE